MGAKWDQGVDVIAAKLKKSPYMVRKYARLRMFGPWARLIGRTWRFNEEGLDDFLAGGKIEMRRGRPPQSIAH